MEANLRLPHHLRNVYAMFILNSIAPIFLLILLGKILRNIEFFPEAFFKGLNKLVFKLALPALLISKLSESSVEAGVALRITVLICGGTLISLVVAWGLAARTGIKREQLGAFIQGSFRSNTAFVGLPLIIYALADLDPRAETLATVVLAPTIILYNLLSVVVLQYFGIEPDNDNKQTFSTALRGILTNPLIIACALGMALNSIGLHLPCGLKRSLDALGQGALPLILLSIGATISLDPVRASHAPTLIASLHKVVLTPALGFLLAPLFGLDPIERMIALIMLASPTAAISYIMADAMHNDAQLAARIVTLSTLLAAITLPILLLIGL